MASLLSANSAAMRRNGDSVFAGAAAAAGRVVSLIAHPQPDAGIENRIQDVDHQIDRNQQQHNDDQVGDDHRAVEMHDRVDQQLAHAGPGEDGFGDDRKGNQRAEFKTGYGGDRYHDVLENVHANDALFVEALGAGEFDVIRQHHLARGGTRQANDQGAFRQAQGDRRQQHVLPAVGGENAELNAEHRDGFAAARGRQPAELHREDHDQHQPDPEIRQAEAQYRAGHDGAGADRVVAQAGIQAERHADQHRHDCGGEGKFQRRRHAFDDQVHRRLPEDEGLAEIAAEGRGDENEVLLPHRLVEAKRFGNGLAIQFGCFGAGKNGERVADHVDAGKHQYRHYCDNEGRL